VPSNWTGLNGMKTFFALIRGTVLLALVVTINISASDIAGAESSRQPCGRAYQIGEFCYQIKGKTASITKYVGKATRVAIPKFVRSKEVTSIGKQALDNLGITAVTLPNSVAEVGPYAFANNHLTSVVLPPSVKTIGKYAFQNNDFTSLTVPRSVVTIDQGAFVSNKLSTLIIPTTVKSIGQGAFAFNNLTAVTLPNSVAEVGPEAFQGDHLLLRVDFTLTAGGESKSFVREGFASQVGSLPDLNRYVAGKMSLVWTCNQTLITQSKFTFVNFDHCVGHTVKKIEEAISFVNLATNTTGQLPQPMSANRDQEISLPSPGLVKNGYVFKGWFDGVATYQPGQLYLVTKNVAFRTVWAISEPTP